MAESGTAASLAHNWDTGHELDMPKNPDVYKLFAKALAMSESGKHTEAAALFNSFANQVESQFEKAGAFLNIAHESKELGQFELARIQLDAARELLSKSGGTVPLTGQDEARLELLAGIELEEARILAANQRYSEALEKLTGLVTETSPLLRIGSSKTYGLLQRERGFVLTHLGLFHEATPLLEEVNSVDPHDRWTVFYLGYSYHSVDKYRSAEKYLKEAISLGLPSEIEGQAHCLLGIAFYQEGDYEQAKTELESGVKTAPPGYIMQARIWKWLESTCRRLGLGQAAERYSALSRPS